MSDPHRPARRQFERHVRIAVSGEPTVRWRLAANLSAGGMFVRDSEPAAEGTLTLVEFVLPDGQAQCRVAAKVAHARQSADGEKPAGMGLEFVDYDQNARKLVEAFRQHADHAQAEAQARSRMRDLSAAEARRPERRVEKFRQEAAPDVEVDGPIIGIDLGTTNSCAAIVRDGKPEIISSPQGYDTIPSVVFVDSDTKVLVGKRAAQRMLMEPEKAIYGSKRFIGRPFASREVQTYGSFFRYGLVADGRGMASAQLGQRIISLEAVAGLILQHIRRMASSALGEEVKRCVVTVPAYFGESQRRAVKQAGQMAGFVVDRILSEPTAAAVAYGYGRGLSKNVIVYDMGGGTFDASVLRIQGEEMEVLATDGDPFLGGSDFDDRLTEYLCMIAEKEHGVDVRKDPVAVQRLRSAAEMAKQLLSQQPHATVDVPFLAQSDAGPVNFHQPIVRDMYEGMTDDLVMRSIQVMDGILKQAGLGADEIDEVVMAGGQSRSPHIHQRILERFGKKPSKRVHPDHAVAIGAAIVASGSETAGVQLTDILPASIRVAEEDELRVLIPRGQSLPASARCELEATSGLEAEFNCTLYRGEAPSPEGNELLGTIRIPSTLAEAVDGTVVEVLLDVSADGLLSVRMEHPETGRSEVLEMSLSEGGDATDALDDVDDIEIDFD